MRNGTSERKGFLVFLVFALIFLLCGSALAVKDTLIVADHYDATTMDPIRHNNVPSSRACLSVYDNLVFMADDGSLIPGLAEKWENISDTEFKFYLRKGVKFHNGETLTAEDVKFTLDRAASEIGAPIRTYSQNIKEVEVLDEHTLVVRLKSVDFTFLPSLSHTWGCIVNKKAVEAAGENYGTVSSGPVGTGPLKFVSWEKGTKYTLERFDDFWGEKVKYKTLVMRSVPEPTSRLVGLETGEIDISYPVAVNDIKRIGENKDLSLLRVPQMSVIYMGFNTLKPPFNDVRVRQAIRAAIDTTGMHAAVWRGVGKVPTSLLPHVMNYSIDNDIKPHVQDMELARKLFAEAGIDPKTLKFNLWTSEHKERIDMTQIIQAQLGELGITTNISVLEWGAFLSGLKQKQHDVFLLGWAAAIPDPNFMLSGLVESTSSSNYTFVNDAKLDEYLITGRMLPDGAEREKVYKDAQNLINEICPMVYLQNDESIAGVQKFVKGFKSKPSALYTFRTVYFEQ